MLFKSHYLQMVNYISDRIPLTSSENVWRLVSKFRTKGIMEKLKPSGLKGGELIVVKGTPFAYEYDEDNI